MMSNKKKIIDTTLREGEQTPGVQFTLPEKKVILDHLVNIGIEEAEIGISSKMHPCAGPLIAYCHNNHPKLEVSLWSRCRKDDIEHAATLEPDILSLSVPVSELHLKYKVKKNHKWILKRMTESIHLARQRGIRVSVGFEDATRAKTDFLTLMATTAERCGAERIRIADTVGIYSPSQTTNLIKTLRLKLENCSLGFHAHNDFGMATANSIAALEAGAIYTDAVVLGLGERTGCGRLEEIVGYLSLAKKSNHYKTEELVILANYVAQITNTTIPSNQPIIGEEIFTCETGLHLQGLQSMPQTYEPFEPEKVRTKRKLKFGTKVGRRALEGKLQQLGALHHFRLSDSTITRIRETALRLRRPLSDTELRELMATQN